MIHLDRRSLLAAIGSLPLWTSAGFAQTASAESYKIGFLMPLTGGSGKLGQMMLEGAQLAQEEINKTGDRKIEIVAEDSQALAKNGIDGFRKLVDVDRVSFIITGWTSVAVAVAPLATASKTYLLSASSASPALRAVSPYFQSTWMFDDETVKLILPYAANQLRISRLAVLTEVSDLGAALSESIRREWKRLGKDISIEESFQAKETNFRPSLLKILATKPDAIYSTSSNGKLSAQVVRQARDLGYEGSFLSYGAFEDPEVLAIGQKAENCFYTSPTFDAASGSEATTSFVAMFTKKFGRAPNVHQANHYDLIKMFSMVAANLARSGKPMTGENFRDEFAANFSTYAGASGGYRFDVKDGSVLRSTVVKTIKDGAFVKVANLD